jgi:hypothetical protein
MCVLLLLLLLLLCGQAQVFFQVPNYKHYFPLFFFLKKREGFLVKKSQQVCLSLSSCCVAFLSEPQKNKTKNKELVGLVKQKEGRKKKVETI